MTRSAAMAYLRALREARSITQADIASLAGVSAKQIYRWEVGISEPPGTGLAIYTRQVQADADTVITLLCDKSATSADGRRLAQELLARSMPTRPLLGVRESRMNERWVLTEEQRTRVEQSTRSVPSGKLAEAIAELRAAYGVPPGDDELLVEIVKSLVRGWRGFGRRNVQ